MAQDPQSHSPHTGITGSEIWCSVTENYEDKDCHFLWSEHCGRDGERLQEAIQTALYSIEISSTWAIPRRHGLPTSQITEKRCRISPLAGFQRKEDFLCFSQAGHWSLGSAWPLFLCSLTEKSQGLHYEPPPQMSHLVPCTMCPRNCELYVEVGTWVHLRHHKR